MDLSRKRQYIQIRQKVSQRLEMNPFLLSRQFLFWVLIGLIGGAIAAAYWLLLEFLLHWSYGIRGLLVVPFMAVLGLLAGLVIHFIGNPGEIDLIVNNIRFNGGRLDYRNNPSMILSSLLCITAGGSAGPEAPLVQVTGSTGTWLARKLKLKGEDVRSLSIAGMAAGFTALFGAPLGAGFFALEILHHKHMVEYYQALIPAFVSSLAAYLVFLLLVDLGVEPIWNFGEYSFQGAFDFYHAILFGLMGAAIGWGFIATFRMLKDAFSRLGWPIYVKTALGGLLLGIIAYFLPITRFFSHHEINHLAAEVFTLEHLLAILVFKLLAIALTLTAGWRGGIIIPLFFLGAVAGKMVHLVFPEINPALAMVTTMAAVNACVTRTPISTIILLSTMTGFHTFIPVMFASLTGFFLAPKTPFIASQFDRVKSA